MLAVCIAICRVVWPNVSPLTVQAQGGHAGRTVQHSITVRQSLCLFYLLGILLAWPCRGRGRAGRQVGAALLLHPPLVVVVNVRVVQQLIIAQLLLLLFLFACM